MDYLVVNNSTLAKLNFLAYRDILNKDVIEDFLEWEGKRVRGRIDDSGKSRKIIKWFHRKKQGLKDFFAKNLKNSPEDFYKKMDRVLSVPHDAPDWLTTKIEETPGYLHENEVYKLRAPLKSDQRLVTKIDHIVDYFVWYLDNNPSKSLDSVTWHQMKSGMEKWEESFVSGEQTSDRMSGEKEVLKTGSFVWVELTDQEALLNEGNRMDHCAGTYGSRVKSGNVKVYSLRDSSNYPFITLEYVPGPHKVVQIQGRSNTLISPRYTDQLRAFLTYLDELKEGESLDVPGTVLSEVGLFKHKETFYHVSEYVPIKNDIRKPEDLGNSDIMEISENFPQVGSHITELDYNTDQGWRIAHSGAMEYITKVPIEVIRVMVRKNPEIYFGLNHIYKSDPELLKKAYDNILEGLPLVSDSDWEKLPRRFRNDPNNWIPVLEGATDKFQQRERLISKLEPNTRLENLELILEMLPMLEPNKLVQGMSDSQLDSILEKDSLPTYFQSLLNKSIDYPDPGRDDAWVRLQTRPLRVEYLKKKIRSGSDIETILRLSLPFHEDGENEALNLFKEDIFRELDSQLLSGKLEIHDIIPQNYGRVTTTFVEIRIQYVRDFKHRTEVFNYISDKMERGNLDIGKIHYSFSLVLDPSIIKYLLSITDLVRFVSDNSSYTEFFSHSIVSDKVLDHFTSLLTNRVIHDILNAPTIGDFNSLGHYILVQLMKYEPAVKKILGYFSDNFDGDLWETFTKKGPGASPVFKGYYLEVEKKALLENYEKNIKYTRFNDDLFEDIDVISEVEKWALKQTDIFDIVELITVHLAPQNIITNKNLKEHLKNLMLKANPEKLGSIRYIGALRSGSRENLDDIISYYSDEFFDHFKKALRKGTIVPEFLLRGLGSEHLPEIENTILELLYKSPWATINKYRSSYSFLRDTEIDVILVKSLRNVPENMQYLPIYEQGIFNTNTFDLKLVLDTDPSLTDIIFEEFLKVTPGKFFTPVSYIHGIESLEGMPGFYDKIAEYYSSEKANTHGAWELFLALKDPFVPLKMMASRGVNLFDFSVFALRKNEFWKSRLDPEFLRLYIEGYKSSSRHDTRDKILLPFKEIYPYLEDEISDQFKSKLTSSGHNFREFIESPVSIITKVLEDKQAKKKFRDVLSKAYENGGYIFKSISEESAKVIYDHDDILRDAEKSIKEIRQDRRWDSLPSDKVLILITRSKVLKDLFFQDLQINPKDLVPSSGFGYRPVFEELEHLKELFSREPFSELLEKEEFSKIKEMVR